eukprot:13680296-Ditylum_brightwellii.AAC.1
MGSSVLLSRSCTPPSTVLLSFKGGEGNFQGWKQGRKNGNVMILQGCHIGTKRTLQEGMHENMRQEEELGRLGKVHQHQTSG